jgi:hypothetical protein
MIYRKKFLKDRYFKIHGNLMLTLINFERWSGVGVGCIGDAWEIHLELEVIHISGD